MEAAQAIAIRNKIIGILARRARMNAGMSMRECGELLGCSPAIYGQYEKGMRGFSMPQLEALAHAFDVPVASLWDDSLAPSEEAPAETAQS